MTAAPCVAFGNHEIWLLILAPPLSRSVIPHSQLSLLVFICDTLRPIVISVVTLFIKGYC